MWILILALAVPVSGSAEVFKKKVPVSFCTSPFLIGKQISECNDNDRFLEEGEKCLDKLDAEEKALAAFLPTAFSANTDAKQTGKFASASLDYTQASAALAYLIATTKMAEGEIIAYKFSLELPPDIDEPDVTGGDELAYAMSVDCYGTNRENLDSLLEDFQKRQTKFEEIKKVADANAGISDTNKRNLDVDKASASGQKVLKAGSAKGSGVKGKANAHPQSDVTGLMQDEEKQQELPK